MDNKDDLKDHIETLHIECILKCKCNQCQYDAEGPRDLREHKESAHGSHSNVSVTPSVVGEVEPNNNNRKTLNMTDKEIVTLEVEDASDSSKSNISTFCPVCGTVFENRRERIAHMHELFEPMSMSDLSDPSDDLLCPTCKAWFRTIKEMDFHEPCPANGGPSETCTTGNKIAERTQNTDLMIDQALGQYCCTHCRATILDPRYERANCLPRTSNEELALLPRPPTWPDLEYQTNRREQSTMLAHGPRCPGLSEVGIVGVCTAKRHMFSPPRISSDAESAIPKKGRAIQKATRKPKTVFMAAHVVTTATSYRRNDAKRSIGGHNCTPPQHKIDHKSKDSSVGHYSDPTEFSDNEDDSNPQCDPTCTIPHSESSNSVVELSTDSDESDDPNDSDSSIEAMLFISKVARVLESTPSNLYQAARPPHVA